MYVWSIEENKEITSNMVFFLCVRSNIYVPNNYTESAISLCHSCLLKTFACQWLEFPENMIFIFFSQWRKLESSGKQWMCLGKDESTGSQCFKILQYKFKERGTTGCTKSSCSDFKSSHYRIEPHPFHLHPTTHSCFEYLIKFNGLFFCA